MSLGESDTRAKLIGAAIHVCGWTEDLIRREETAGAIEVIKGYQVQVWGHAHTAAQPKK